MEEELSHVPLALGYLSIVLASLCALFGLQFCSEFTTYATICNCCIVLVFWMERVIFLGLFFLFETVFSVAVLHQSTQCIKKCEVSHPDILQAA